MACIMLVYSVASVSKLNCQSRIIDCRASDIWLRDGSRDTLERLDITMQIGAACPCSVQLPFCTMQFEAYGYR
jgi:hypothetical protein